MLKGSEDDCLAAIETKFFYSVGIVDSDAVLREFVDEAVCSARNLSSSICERDRYPSVVGGVGPKIQFLLVWVISLCFL